MTVTATCRNCATELNVKLLQKVERGRLWACRNKTRCYARRTAKFGRYQEPPTAKDYKGQAVYYDNGYGTKFSHIHYPLDERNLCGLKTTVSENKVASFKVCPECESYLAISVYQKPRRLTWNTLPVPERVALARNAGLEGRIGSKNWKDIPRVLRSALLVEIIDSIGPIKLVFGDGTTKPPESWRIARDR